MVIKANYLLGFRAKGFIGFKAFEITATDLTLDFVLDEKAREFYFEAQRRTDLIRYNKFTSNYTMYYIISIGLGIR